MYKKTFGIILVLLIILVIFFLIKNKKEISTTGKSALVTNTNVADSPKDSVKTLTDEELRNISDSSKWKTYTNEDIGIVIQYPELLGPINVWGAACENKKRPDDCYSHIGLQFQDKALFVATMNRFAAKSQPAREAYFGDLSENIKDAEYIKDFCAKYTTKLAFGFEVEQCKVYKTDNGITVAKFKSGIPFTDNEKGHIYLIKSPNPVYYGLVFSDQQLIANVHAMEAGWDKIDTEILMDKIVNSLKFAK